MTKIRLDRNSDYTLLDIDQIIMLFGVYSFEFLVTMRGFDLLICKEPGYDRGFFTMLVRGYKVKNGKLVVSGEHIYHITLGDDEIKKHIEISKSMESKHGGYVSLRQEYRDRGVSPEDFI